MDLAECPAASACPDKISNEGPTEFLLRGSKWAECSPAVSNRDAYTRGRRRSYRNDALRMHLIPDCAYTASAGTATHAVHGEERESYSSVEFILEAQVQAGTKLACPVRCPLRLSPTFNQSHGEVEAPSVAQPALKFLLLLGKRPGARNDKVITKFGVKKRVREGGFRFLMETLGFGILRDSVSEQF